MAAVNVASVVSEVAAQSVAIVAVGGAVLVLLVTIKAFKWVKRALTATDGGGTHYGNSFAAADYYPDNYEEWARRETLASREYDSLGK